MSSKLLLDDKTVTQISDYLRNPSHGLLITGTWGSGKYAIAKDLAANLLKLKDLHSLDSYPYFYEIKLPADKKEIPIEHIRELIKKLNLRTTGSENIRRVVIIEDANYLSAEAQNSLLKTLEEPSADTVFILTAPTANSLLPTTVSRLHKLQVYPITTANAKKYFANSYDDSAVQSAWALSGGAAGLLISLLQEDKSHPLKTSVLDFKAFLSANSYSRMLILDQMTKDKVALSNFLDAGLRIMTALHSDALSKGDRLLASRLINKKKKLLQSMTKLNASASPRLIILDLALNL